MKPDAHDTHDDLSLCEALDRLLHKGVVLRGEVKISVADVDLIYLGLQVLLASTDTARRFLDSPWSERPALWLGSAGWLAPVDGSPTTERTP